MASGTLVDRYTGVDRYAVCDSRFILVGYKGHHVVEHT